MRFTKAEANKALEDEGLNWESPMIDIIDTLTDAIEEHYLRQGVGIHVDDLIERATTLAHRWAK